MIIQQSTVDSTSISTAFLKRLRRLTCPQSAFDLTVEDCPVDALRKALVRESELLKLKEALIQEQELLRKESEHRFLNGLQMVISLLALQARTTTNPDVVSQLSVAANRIATIERVHRRLHSNDGTKTVALKQYLEEFCQDFWSVMVFEDATDMSILVEGCEIDIPSSTAIPLGFIINELITNAVKHGKGPVVVGLDTDPGNGYILSVCNDGPPLPDGFNPAASTGLGMKIISALVRTIGGELCFGRGADDQGARFVVEFS